jgi:DNA-binding protein HU-beta
MNKIELAEIVSGKTGITKKNTQDIISEVFEVITKELSEGKEVAISGFGSFFVKKRSARMGVNPRTGQKIEIAATVTPKFRAGKNLKDAVK